MTDNTKVKRKQHKLGSDLKGLNKTSFNKALKINLLTGDQLAML